METIYTVPEVAEHLKICKSKMYELVRRGEISYIKIGKNVRIRESDLVDWLDKQHRPARQMGLGFPES
jgi:putative molybdopterin biosynthesis protein